MIERFAEKFLNEWFAKKSRKPLVLRGARQVGKSTLVRQFAQKAGLVLNEINLERYLALDEVFKTTDTEQICRELEAIIGRDVRAKGTVLFLDEIQATPYALMALRYFLEDLPELPVIAAGSLLEFALADHSFSMPVGRIEYYHLYPLSFSEFVGATKPSLHRYFKELDLTTAIPTAAHEKLLQQQRLFFYVGGMPEAVAVYRETKSLAEVTAIHRTISNTYQDDFSKYAKSSELVLLQKIFSHAPRNLGRKVKYSNIAKELQTSKVKLAISLLCKARVCHQVFHSHCSGLPLSAEMKDTIYKILFLDIGLVNHICGLDWLAINSLDDQQLVNEGGLAEQFIGQHLLNMSNGLEAPQLHYWLREGKSANAEVDYVISRGNWIVPVEVKAGKSGSLKSLHHFVFQKGSKYAVRFDLNPASIQQITHKVVTAKGSKEVDFILLSFPLYGVEEMSRLIDSLRQKQLMTDTKR